MLTRRHIRKGARRRAALLYMLLLLCGPTPASFAAPAASDINPAAASLSVTTSADTADGNTSSLDALVAQPGPDGAISLREALLATNAISGTAALTIGFNLPASGAGYDSTRKIWTITLGALALPALSRGNLTIDGRSQPGGSASHPPIAIDGYAVYEAPGRSNGLTITSAKNTVRGLTLMNFYDDAILLDGAGAAFNQVAGCYLGAGPEGGAPRANSYFGVEIRAGAHDNLIGGAGPAARNLIGSNDHSGVFIQGANTTHNTVAGSWIGADASGQAPLGNQVAGVMISGGAHDNQIGGAGQGNLIAANDVGIYLDGAVGTLIAGNTIGLAADGRAPLGNGSGGIFAVNGSRANQIGGADAGLRNVIGSNGAANSAFGQGIYLSDPGTSDNLVLGNYIGTDTSGIAPSGNLRQGLLIAAGAQHNQVGSAAPGGANVIAYNGLGGVRIDSPYNQVVGNLVGLGADGRAQLGNQANGVRVVGNNNTIGPGNTIANNQQSGLLVLGSNTTVVSNTLEANGRSGVCVAGAGATIDRNLVRGNGASAGPWPECSIRGGVVITGTSSALVTNNQIIANRPAGVIVYGGRGNRILANQISEHPSAGIQLLGGANDALSPPRLGDASANGIAGTSCPVCRVEVFSDSADEGRYFIGATIAGSDGSFWLPYQHNKISGAHLTATQTDGAGNTSAFAQPVDRPAPAPDPTPTPDTFSLLFLPLVGR